MTAPAPPRPVTPVGILAEELGRLVGGMDRDGTVSAEDLRAAWQLAAGLDRYVERCTSPESPALERLAADTRAEDWTSRNEQGAQAFLEQEMLSGHVEGQFLNMLVHATRATTVLEIGTFTGYAALAMAEALPPGGHLVACELDPGVAELARQHLADSPAGRRVEVRTGPASTTLRQLAVEGARFDLVFIDADKAGYGTYLDALLDDGLLEPHGLICIDNTLLQGEPWKDGPPSTNGAAIADFNQRLRADDRVEQVLVPLRDGVTLVRRAGGRT